LRRSPAVIPLTVVGIPPRRRVSPCEDRLVSVRSDPAHETTSHRIRSDQHPSVARGTHIPLASGGSIAPVEAVASCLTSFQIDVTQRCALRDGLGGRARQHNTSAQIPRRREPLDTWHALAAATVLYSNAVDASPSPPRSSRPPHFSPTWEGGNRAQSSLVPAARGLGLGFSSHAIDCIRNPTAIPSVTHAKHYRVGWYGSVERA
jgi:hypothetical protein